MITLINQLRGVELLVVSVALALVLVMSFTLHEFAHAMTAYKCGDYTPKSDNRLTLNPIYHLDPIGFLCCFLFCFGWAKPVRINPINFKHYKKDMFLVSIAGVLTNLALALVFSFLFVLLSRFEITNYYAMFILYFCNFAYVINISLFVFNLLPVYPLDGFNAINALTKYDNKFVLFMQKYGSYILLFILLFCSPVIEYIVRAIEYPILKLWTLILG